MRTEMTDNALRAYLGLSWEELGFLRQGMHEEAMNRLRTLDQVSTTLEQLATKSNRPPAADAESDAHLDARSERAFARLDAAVAANAGVRHSKGDAAQRGRNKPAPWDPDKYLR